MMKVLIVDNEETMSDLIREMVEEEGTYYIKTAANGEEGYMVSLRFDPDIIITDIQMPVKNGIDMVRQIRTHRPGIKTVYISADLSRYQKSLKEEKLKYHAMTLQKPFSRFELIGAISKKTV